MELKGSPLDRLIEGFQLIDLDYRYLYINEAAASQGKRTVDELTGNTMIEMYPGIEKTDMFKALKRCMKERIHSHFENEFTFPDGSKEWFELRMHPVPQGVFILSIDISERKQAELHRREYILGLEEMIFLTTHRVRQPVANILGILDILDRAKFSKKELELVASSLKESVQKLDVFTHELVDYLHALNEKHHASEHGV